MKKIFLLLLTILSLTIIQGCNPVNDNENTQIVPPIEEPEIPSIDEPLLSDGLHVDKTIYRKGEKIIITVIGYDNTHSISVMNAKTTRYILGQHVAYSEMPLKRGVQEYSLNVNALRGTGEYIVYLHTQLGDRVMDKKLIKVLTEDETDYKVLNAVSETSVVENTTKAKITITPSSLKKLTYRLYWSKQGKRLPNYTYLIEEVVENKEKFELTLNDNIFMPSDADGIEIEVFEGLSTSTFISVDNKLKLNNSNYILNFQALSDIHIDGKSLFSIHNSNWFQALMDVKLLENQSSGIFVVGDHTNKGTQENYDVLFETVNDVYPNKEIPIHYAIGNHEYMYHNNIEEGINFFLEQTKMPGVYYSLEIQGYKFIVLGSESYAGEGALSDTQLTWFKNEMATVDKSKPTFVFIHQPLYDTVSGSLPGQGWDGFRNDKLELRSILKDHVNTIVFSGHTHWSFNETRPVLYGNGIDASFVNLGSVGYLWNDQDKQEPGSQGMFIDIYEDYILIRGREFQEDAWVSNAQFKFDIFK